MPEKPYSRDEYNRALIANAVLDPFTIALVAAMLVAGMLLGSLIYIGPAAAAVYIGSALRTYFDEDAAQKVLERERRRRGRELESGRRKIDPKTLAPPIARLIAEARTREQRVAEAIERSELPYEEVTAEVDRFVAAMDATALRAQALFEAMVDTPPDDVERRLQAIRAGNQPETQELAAALEVQLSTLRRMERQLQRFFVEMERIIVELETVRGQVVSMSAAADRTSQDQLAADVRGLRERMGAVAEGMAEAYESEGAA